MNPRTKNALADFLGIAGFGIAVFGLYQISMPLACIVGGVVLTLVGATIVRR